MHLIREGKHRGDHRDGDGRESPVDLVSVLLRPLQRGPPQVGLSESGLLD